MIFGLYSIKDAKTGFMTPVLEQNDASALRNFSAAVNQPDSLMHQFPNDFSLFKIANFDSDYGLEPFSSAVMIVDASEVLRSEK